jgi:glycosyltransferase involved in cell wall biosynthesis
MADKPLISFVLPTYNRMEWIGECLQSLLTQTVKEIEIIIVEDGSTDGTREFLADWCPQFPNVRVILNETNIGAGRSRNIGAAAAKADIIGVCDSDDIYADQRAELILEHFKLNPKSELVTFPYRAIGYYNEKLEDHEGEPFNHEDFLAHGRVNFFSNPSAAYKKAAAEEIGGYEPEFEGENLKQTDDVQFLHKWVKSGRKVDFQPGYLICFHRVLQDSMMAKVRGWDPKWATNK